MFLRFLSVLLISIFCLPASVLAEEPPHMTTARLFSSVEGVDQLKTVQVGVTVKLEQGWKTYWRTPGEAGLAPVFDWAGSSNFRAARILWPAPTRFNTFGMDNFGYENEVTFPVDIDIAEPGKPISLKLRLDLLICHKICVPESHRLSLTVSERKAIVTADQALLAEAARKIPVPGDEAAFSVSQAWLESSGKKETYLYITALSDTAPNANADMFVETPSFINVGKPAISYDSKKNEWHLKSRISSGDPAEALEKDMSHMTLTVVQKDRAFERSVTLSGVRNSSTPENIIRFTQDHISLDILLLAFLGGLILNLMPCVLPVLSLKILSVLSHGGKDHRVHRWIVFKNFTASALGILFSFWVIAGVLAFLKTAGQSIGWGIQFQHPGFLLFMILALLAFAANMWGLYEIPLPRFIARNVPAHHEHEPTLAGHFLTGAFAALMATPCTAPFLGTAIGFALARGTTDIFIVFTFLGLGLAFPYIALALSPRVFKYMPKPGRWMIGLKKTMALVLLISAVWLTSVLTTISTQATLDEGWMPFNEALIRPAVEEGKTVVVDVTADWCLTCKANKRLVLDQPDIKEALFEPNILRLQADWTHRDETIASYLRKYGRYGVPFNIIYGPGAPNGIILGEILSRRSVLHALAEAAAE